LGGITPVQHDPGTRGSEPLANQEEGHGKTPLRTNVPRKRQKEERYNGPDSEREMVDGESKII